jgi:predicted anti-sigma-YlaC factor YlaD
MKDMNYCEDILIQKLARLDGEKTELSAEQIDVHLANCENCRQEIAQLENTALLLSRQRRQVPDADLWAAVEKQIGASPASGSALQWQPLVLLGAFLVVYKLLEMIPERDFGWALKIVPFILVAGVFGFLKENPFKINTELILEK